MNVGAPTQAMCAHKNERSCKILLRISFNEVKLYDMLNTRSVDGIIEVLSVYFDNLGQRSFYGRMTITKRIGPLWISICVHKCLLVLVT